MGSHNLMVTILGFVCEVALHHLAPIAYFRSPAKWVQSEKATIRFTQQNLCLHWQIYDETSTETGLNIKPPLS